MIAAAGRISILTMWIVAGFILRRLLTPEDFGVVVFATSISLFLSRIYTWGFDDALLHRQDSEEKVASAHLMWQIRLAGVALILAFVLSLFLNHFFGTPRQVLHVLILLTAAKIIFVAGSTPKVLLEKQQRIKSIIFVEVTGTFMSFVVAITVAWLWPEHGVWALVAQRVVEIVLHAGGFWLINPTKIRRDVDPVISRWMILDFGLPLWIGSCFFIVTFQLPNFLVGRMIGLAALGVYSTAFRFAELPRDLCAFLPRISSPVYARLQDDRIALSEIFEKMQGMLLRGIVIVVILIAMLIPDLIEMVGWADDWKDVVPLIRVLALFSICHAFFVNLPGVATVGLGMTKIQSKVQILQGVSIAILCPALILAFRRIDILLAPFGAAIAMSVMVVVSTIALLWMIARHIDIHFGRMMLPPLVAGLGAAATGYGLDYLLQEQSPWMRVPLLFISIAFVYFVVLFLLEGRKLIRLMAEFCSLLFSSSDNQTDRTSASLHDGR